MIPSQISYTPSQGAYYIPGQVRAMLWTLWEGVRMGSGGRCCLGLESRSVLGRWKESRDSEHPLI